MMHEDGNFGTTMGTTSRALRPSSACSSSSRVPYSLRSPDVTTELTKIKAAKPDPW